VVMTVSSGRDVQAEAFRSAFRQGLPSVTYITSLVLLQVAFRCDGQCDMFCFWMPDPFCGPRGEARGLAGSVR
jgi:hypothetical protein